MSNLVPLDQAGKLPAHLAAFATEGNEFGFSGVGYPTISLKGKVFHIVRGKEKTLVTKPGGDGEPAGSLEVVVLAAGPKKGYARTFYAGGFVEGSTDRPDCSALDGETPDADAPDKQSAKCAICPQNAKGSGATAQNPQAKACRSSKLLAVAPAGQLNDPMLLRVPGDSLMPLSEYGDFLAKRGVRSAAVVTKISFDYSVAHPKLSFKAIGGITPEMAAEVLPMITNPVVRRIIGERAVDDVSEGAPQIEAPVATATVTATTHTNSAFSVGASAPAEPAKPAKTTRAKAAAAPQTGSPAAPPQSNVKQPAAVVAAASAGMDEALDALDFDN